MAIRTLPSTLPLERIISRWDFYKDLKDNKTISEDDLPLGIPMPTKLPLFFHSPEEYIDAYTPLFLLETNNMVHRAKDFVMNKLGEPMIFQKFVKPKDPPDDFLKLELLQQKSAEAHEDMKRKYTTGDIVLLSQNPNPQIECDNHFLAFVENFSFGRLSVKANVCLKKCPRSKRFAIAVAGKKSWYVSKVDSCSTIFREYIALCYFPKLQLVDHLILSASEEKATLMHIPDSITEALKSRFNESQLAAIQSSRKAEGITLILGPPGTGKTSTIIGILSVLLQCKGGAFNRDHGKDEAEKTKKAKTITLDSDEESTGDDEPPAKKARREAYLRESSPWNHPGYDNWMDTETYTLDVKTMRHGPGGTIYPVYPRDTENEKHMWKDSDHSIPRKVLVTAPSNAAVDEIIRRLVRDGIIGPDGERKVPNLVRCGPNVHEQLADYSLNKMALSRCKVSSGQADQAKLEKAKTEVLDDAQIVLATTSVAGSRDLQLYSTDFDTCVIDEASQGVEMSTLIPLVTGCRRLILVGDPKQLPATVFSQAAKDLGYDRSLFQRLQESHHPVDMLNTQFRMHPQIAMFPSTCFYDGNLKSHYGRAEFEKKFPAPWSKIPCFSPVTFFHVPGSEQQSMQSYCNEDEAMFCVQLFMTVRKLFPDFPWAKSVGIVSPYQEQVKLIRKYFSDHVDGYHKDVMDISTVDGFQGREKEVIIVSSVRADTGKKSIGFLKDVRRMNVAFTRPRRNLWVLGHAQVLAHNSQWSQFLEFVTDHCEFIKVKGRKEDFLQRYLHKHFDENPHLPRPANLGPLSGEEAVVENEPLSKEEIDDLMKEAELQRKYKEADLNDMEDDYNEIQEEPLGVELPLLEGGKEEEPREKKEESKDNEDDKE